MLTWLLSGCNLGHTVSISGIMYCFESMEGKKRHYSMHTSLFLYVGNLILFCKLCHYIMQIVI